MPLFEYRCEACGKEFEELVFKESAPVPCPACGSDKTNKLLSCCRFKTEPSGPRSYIPTPATGGSRSGCSGCSGGSCSTCG